ncbi:MAG: hypothetical protein IPN13_16735 [Bacteroidetes bacterium]|nr:hypothetical protein [Bacteroidota bacterium]
MYISKFFQFVLLNNTLVPQEIRLTQSDNNQDPQFGSFVPIVYFYCELWINSLEIFRNIIPLAMLTRPNEKEHFLITLILFCYNLFATIRIVPIQYASIQTALDSSSTGDTVLVQPGTYFENIYWPNVANIKLFSDGDSSNTVINGGGLKAVITLDGDIMSVTIDTNTVIKGFKITGGGCTVGFFCGGMHMYKCSPKITEVSITENYSTESVGAGIVATDSNFSLSNSSVTFNALGSNTSLSGAGVYVGYGSPVFNNVDISGNSFGDNTSWNQGGEFV